MLVKALHLIYELAYLKMRPSQSRREKAIVEGAEGEAKARTEDAHANIRESLTERERRWPYLASLPISPVPLHRAPPIPPAAAVFPPPALHTHNAAGNKDKDLCDLSEDLDVVSVCCLSAATRGAAKATPD